MILVARSGHQEKKLVWSPALREGTYLVALLCTLYLCDVFVTCNGCIYVL